MIGGGATLTTYGFLSDPYRSRFTALGGYAPYSNRGSLVAGYEHRAPCSRSALRVEAGLSGFIVVNFFGFGNESQGEVSAKDDYHFRQTHLYVVPSMETAISRTVRARAGLLFRHVSTEFDEEAPRIDRTVLYGLENTSIAAVTAGFRHDSRDLPEAPRQGLYADVAAGYYPALFDTRERFVKASADVRAYASAHLLTEWTLALRAGGERIWGAYPFFEAAFLGGLSSARGFAINRFAGDASIFGGAELRFDLLDVKLLVPSEFGGFVYLESGRVYYTGEISERWHVSYGGGAREEGPDVFAFAGSVDDRRGADGFHGGIRLLSGTRRRSGEARRLTPDAYPRSARACRCFSIPFPRGIRTRDRSCSV
jgi:hypothetical protein